MMVFPSNVVVESIQSAALVFTSCRMFEFDDTRQFENMAHWPILLLSLMGL